MKSCSLFLFADIKNNLYICIIIHKLHFNMSVYFEDPFKGNNVKEDIKALNKRCFYLEKELEEYKNNKNTNKTNTYEEWERENKEFLLEFFERYANISGYFGKNYIEIGLSLDNKKFCKKALFNKSNFVY